MRAARCVRAANGEESATTWDGNRYRLRSEQVVQSAAQFIDEVSDAVTNRVFDALFAWLLDSIGLRHRV